MEKNYYDILEVSKYASPEVIEKAYKTLVKKYHPDLQENGLKSDYEQKLKLINEAYDILSDNDKKSKYDQELAQIEAQKKIIQEKANQQAFNYNQINEIKNHNQINNEVNNLQKQRNLQEEYNKRMNAAVNKAYHDAYIQDLKNRGYKIRYKKTFKDYMINIVSLLVLVAIFIILWQIPFIRKFFINMYNDNPFLKTIVDAFISILKGNT